MKYREACPHSSRDRRTAKFGVGQNLTIYFDRIIWRYLIKKEIQ